PALYNFARELSQNLKPKLDPEHVQSLVGRMDDLVDELTAATNAGDKIDAQFNAFNAFSQACQEAGLKPERPGDHALLEAAFNAWVGGLGQRGPESLRRLCEALTEKESLQVTAGLGALTHSDSPMRAFSVSDNGDRFLQDIAGLDLFVQNLA